MTSGCSPDRTGSPETDPRHAGAGRPGAGGPSHPIAPFTHPVSSIRLKMHRFLERVAVMSTDTDAAREKAKEKAKTFFQYGNDAAMKSNFDYAISMYQSCCKLDPDNLIY